MDLKSRLESHSITTLRKEISKTNIKGYSKMKKAEVVALMLKHSDRFNHIQQREKVARKAPAPRKAPEPKKEEPKKVKKIIKKPEPKEEPKEEPKKAKKIIKKPETKKYKTQFGNNSQMDELDFVMKRSNYVFGDKKEKISDLKTFIEGVEEDMREGRRFKDEKQSIKEAKKIIAGLRGGKKKKKKTEKEATSIQEINRRSAEFVARKNKRAENKRNRIANEFLKKIGSDLRL